MELRHQGRRTFVHTFRSTPGPEEPAVVFIHGAGMDHSVWTPFGRYFARQGIPAVAVDLPGHGRSEGPPLERVEDLGAWLAELLETLGPREAHLVGHSLGSLVALETAVASPERTGSIALVGTAVPMPVTEALLDAARRNDPAAIDMITIWGHGPDAHRGGISNPGVWMTGAARRLLERAAPGVLHADLAACNAYKRGLEQAARVDVPALLLLGERDAMTPPRAARALGAALPRSRTVVIPRCGHMHMQERPNEVLDALAAHIEAAREEVG